jgi:hypothetical protein
MTNNKQQTSVEWLEIELEKLWVEKYLSPITIKPLLDQAKEMQKQITIKLYNDYENYLEESFKNQCGGQAVVLSFGAFYDQTYGGEQ